MYECINITHMALLNETGQVPKTCSACSQVISVDLGGRRIIKKDPSMLLAFCGTLTEMTILREPQAKA